MADTPSISVVIPVFNPGPGILRCIDSLQSQRLENLEFIFVDDCGTDGAMDAVIAAANQDPRIRIIRNSANMGAGQSRNAGIDAASGTYLSFVDPDDWVGSDFFELLWSNAESSSHPDIVKGTHCILQPDGTPNAIQAGAYENRRIETALSKGAPLWLTFCYFHQTAIYNRSLFGSFRARYGSSRSAQDITFLLRTCSLANSFATEQSACYYYMVRSESASRNLSPRRLEYELNALDEQIETLTQIDCSPQHAADYLVQRLNRLIGIASTIENLPKCDTPPSTAQAITEHIKNMPSFGSLVRRDASVHALTHHGILLEKAPYAPNGMRATATDWTRVARKWVDYAFAHPELAHSIEPGLFSVYKGAISACVFEGIIESSVSERKAALSTMSKDLRRLISSEGWQPFSKRLKPLTLAGTGLLKEGLTAFGKPWVRQSLVTIRNSIGRF